ncbi:ribosome small subunit-dependent GTPase A [Desertibacillus haloalkaliphilus]|uniref:ribosome small subunit-dependent GTPase A n=1 Tax=Desertibacillus haloalkaliphilus TaxID=1328930 RepID=UPI001C280F3A|nr:ribosome small subunit-dependent GTPase A [Desertibacillus haloalkaliphilus]MBU8907058.1 ribosome small subunit-dependent GTPase A [Desertibacillus haloalkaliphilus]
MAEGKIIKALSGFYYVQNDDGIVQCRGRGNFRKRKIKPLVGDDVEFEAENPTDGYILDVFERKNELVRPPISNIDQAILVFSVIEPQFSTLLLDRFLVHIEAHQIAPVICLTKLDLIANEPERLEQIEQYRKDYEAIGYDVVMTSSETKDGLEQLLPYFEEKVSVIAGQSGVGKSSLLNSIRPDLAIETNQISTHLGRGKHTTRHVELIEIGNGLVADTPGFSSLDFTTIEAKELSSCFPEMRVRLPDCKFRGCTHVSEPKCMVKEGLEQDEILKYRYEHYLEFLEEIKNRKRRY